MKMGPIPSLPYNHNSLSQFKSSLVCVWQLKSPTSSLIAAPVVVVAALVAFAPVATAAVVYCSS
jgi:hypothetical protein